MIFMASPALTLLPGVFSKKSVAALATCGNIVAQVIDIIICFSIIGSLSLECGLVRQKDALFHA